MMDIPQCTGIVTGETLQHTAQSFLCLFFSNPIAFGQLFDF